MNKTKLSIVPLLLLLAACQTNPFSTAQTVEQRGDALYGSYVIAKEQGALILQNAGISDEAKRPLAELMVASKPVGDAGQAVLIEYSTVKGEVERGVTPQEKLTIVEQNIAAWIERATPLITKLIETVGGLRK